MLIFPTFLLLLLTPNRRGVVVPFSFPYSVNLVLLNLLCIDSRIITNSTGAMKKNDSR